MKITNNNGKLTATYTYDITQNKIKQKNKDDEIKIYTSYRVNIPKELVDVVCNNNLETYIYEDAGHTYMSSCEPDTLHSHIRRRIYTIQNGYNFALPKKLFNLNDEVCNCKYFVHLSLVDNFCKNNPLVEIVVK